MRIGMIGLVASCLLVTASDASAQFRLPRGFEITAYAGRVAFGDFHDHVVDIRAAGGDRLNEDPSRRAITASTAASAGAAATYWIRPLWGIRLHYASATTRFAERYEDEAERLLRADPDFVELPAFAPLRISIRDLVILFRVPARVGELSAYGMAGAGRISYSTRPDGDARIPVGAGEAFGDNGRFTSSAGVGGIGAHYPLGRIQLVAEVTNHVGRSPVRTVGEVEIFRSERLVATSIPPATANQDEPGERGARVNTLRFTLGVTLALR